MRTHRFRLTLNQESIGARWILPTPSLLPGDSREQGLISAGWRVMSTTPSRRRAAPQDCPQTAVSNPWQSAEPATLYPSVCRPRRGLGHQEPAREEAPEAATPGALRSSHGPGRPAHGRARCMFTARPLPHPRATPEVPRHCSSREDLVQVCDRAQHNAAGHEPRRKETLAPPLLVVVLPATLVVGILIIHGVHPLSPCVPERAPRNAGLSAHRRGRSEQGQSTPPRGCRHSRQEPNYPEAKGPVTGDQTRETATPRSLWRGAPARLTSRPRPLRLRVVGLLSAISAPARRGTLALITSSSSLRRGTCAPGRTFRVARRRGVKPGGV